MKVKLSILCFLTVNLLYGQYDYFKWSKTNSNLLGVNISPKSDLVTDVFNNCYYIDNTSKKIRSQYGEVLPSAPIARTNSNLIYRVSSSPGDRIYYVTSTHKISSLKYNNSASAWQVGTEFSGIADNVAPLSFIEVVDHNQAYYVRNSDKKVCTYWSNSSGSGYGPISAAALPAADYSNIVLKSSTIYYISNGNKISYIKYNSTTSLWEAPVNTNCDVIATGSKIQVSNDGNQVFYVRAADNKLCSYTISNSANLAPLDKLGITVMSGSDLVIPSSGDQVIYIGTDGNFHNEYYDFGKWVHSRLNAVCNINTNANYNAYALDNSGVLQYFDGTNICKLSRTVAPTDFVHRKGSRLAMNGQKYNAKIADYCLNIYRRNGAFFIGPSNHYDDDWTDWVCLTPLDCEDPLDIDFSDIADAGFNTIRLNGLHIYCNNTLANPNADPKIYVDVWDIPANGTNLPTTGTRVDINAGSNLSQILAAYTAVVNKAGNYGLKVNFFAGMEGGHKIFNTACHNNYGNYLVNLANNFKNNPNILMYNLLLEADLYNTTDANEIITDKDYICSTVNGWYDQIRSVDKNHLVSLGNIGTTSLLTWDPGILNVDVITYHLYPDLNLTYQNYNTDAFLKNLKWLSNVMNDQIQKPWIIGETGVPGVLNPAAMGPPTPGSMTLAVDYATQKNYAAISMQNIFLSGASGYGWWQYRDVYGPNSEDRGLYFGLVDHAGNKKPIIANGNSVFNTTTITNGCNQGTAPNDYYNNLTPYPFSLTGHVQDSYGQSSPNALVKFDVYCGGSNKTYSTFTNSNGDFLLYSQCPITQIRIWGVGAYTKTIGSPVNGATHTITPVTCNSNYTKSVGQSEADQSGTENSLDESNNILDEDALTISPNPFTSKVKFSFDTEQTLTSIRITDVLGKEVENITFSGKEFEINLEGAPKGIYIVKITNSESKTMIKRIIAQ